jgi:hypothetical protein
LAKVFLLVKDEALKNAGKGISIEPKELRRLDHRSRIVLGLFGKKDRINAQDIALALGLSSRMVRVLAQKWVKDNFLIVADESNRSRAYGLSAIYRQFIGNGDPSSGSLYSGNNTQ